MKPTKFSAVYTPALLCSKASVSLSMTGAPVHTLPPEPKLDGEIRLLLASEQKDVPIPRVFQLHGERRRRSLHVQHHHHISFLQRPQIRLLGYNRRRHHRVWCRSAGRREGQGVTTTTFQQQKTTLRLLPSDETKCTLINSAAKIVSKTKDCHRHPPSLLPTLSTCTERQGPKQ